MTYYRIDGPKERRAKHRAGIRKALKLLEDVLADRKSEIDGVTISMDYEHQWIPGEVYMQREATGRRMLRIDVTLKPK